MFAGGQLSTLFSKKESSSEYTKFTGWAYTAINAIAKRAARQSPRMAKSEATLDKAATFVKSYEHKSHVLTKHQQLSIFNKRFTPPHIKSRADNTNVVMIDRHPLLDAINHPNDLMTKWSLFYVTIASLELTGRAYWWFYKSKDKAAGTQELYIWPIPSNWVTPISSPDRVHSSYKILPPGSATSFEIPSEQMVPFHLPDPANPTQSISPLRTQMNAVELDGLIQTAQTVSMKQGVYPGVILTAGRLPDMPGGMQGQRPVLTAAQRQDIVTAIRGAYQGVHNFNEPFIVDGLIEDVKPFTHRPVEMAFNESGANVKSRIFGAFGLNPIVIGEIAGANRAQASVAEDNFISNVVNPLLEMIGEVITVWIGRNETLAELGSGQDVFMWIDPAEAHDADIQIELWRLGLRFRCVNRNEFRTAMLDLSPEDEFDSPPPAGGGGEGGDGGGGTSQDGGGGVSGDGGSGSAQPVKPAG
jgi:phage portal protein BeeE